MPFYNLLIFKALNNLNFHKDSINNKISVSMIKERGLDKERKRERCVKTMCQSISALKQLSLFFCLVTRVYISEKERVTSRTPRTSYLEKLISKKND